MMTSTLEKFEDNKGQIRSHNEGQTIQWPKEKDKGTQNDQQNITQKSKDRETRTPLTTGDAPKCVVRVVISCSTSGTRHLSIKGF